jgi:hypothetical protein
MKLKFTYRFAFMSLAFALAILIVYILSVAGDSSKGPISNMLNKVGENIQDVEKSLIIDTREDKRKDKLKSFDSIRNNIELLKNPKAILLGASDNTKAESYERIINLEDTIHTVFPLISVYNAWGSKETEKFPELAVQTIVNLGSTPVITWEPWLNDFDVEEYPGIPAPDKRGKGSLRAIANGTYDNYIKNWAQKLKEIQKPVLLRFGHEMNDPYRYPWGPQNNKPKDYVNAWKHIRKIFDSLQINNVIWVWAPHPAYGYLDAFYPGDEYVDYIGIGILNFGTAATWSKWWTFEELFGVNYDKFSSFNKPIMITEFGSLVVGGNRGHWFADALKKIPKKYPLLKSIVFFHYPADKTITSKTVSWYFIDDKESRDSISYQINKWPDSLKIR